MPVILDGGVLIAGGGVVDDCCCEDCCGCCPSITVTLSYTADTNGNPGLPPCAGAAAAMNGEITIESMDVVEEGETYCLYEEQIWGTCAGATQLIPSGFWLAYNCALEKLAPETGEGCMSFRFRWDKVLCQMSIDNLPGAPDNFQWYENPASPLLPWLRLAIGFSQYPSGPDPGVRCLGYSVCGQPVVLASDLVITSCRDVTIGACEPPI